MNEMTEEMKEDSIRDKLYYLANAISPSPSYAERAKIIIKLVRALDSYRERDGKGRFVKADYLEALILPCGQGRGTGGLK